MTLTRITDQDDVDQDSDQGDVDQDHINNVFVLFYVNKFI